MRKLRYFFSMIAMVYAAVAWSAVNSTFTANTIEGVSLTYKITSEGTYNFVQVGTGVDYWATWDSYPDVVTGTTVTIPETVTYNGVTYRVNKIADYAFKKSKVTRVNISQYIYEIGSSAFEGSTIQDVYVDGRVLTTIGSNAFKDCMQLTTTHTLPCSLQFIESYAFSGCTNLSEIKFSTLKNDGEEAQGLFSIGIGAFLGCDALTSFSIPYTVKQIHMMAFSGCDNLASVTFDRDAALGEQPQISFIGTYAFSGCIALTNINNLNRCTSLYKVDDYAFQNCRSITTIALPSGVNTLGKYAFQDCVALENMYLGNTQITTVDNYAFQNCSALTYITLPSTVTSVGSNAFNGCSSLVSLTLPDGVTSIGDYAFSGCSALAAFTLPSSLITISSYAFNGCSQLSSNTSYKLTIPQMVTSIGAYAFSNCLVTKLAVLNFTPATLDANSFANLTGPTIEVPTPDYLAAYQAADVWKNYTIVAASNGTVGDVFRLLSPESVEVSYKILTTGDTKTCAVGTGTSAAIDTETTGKVTLASDVYGYSVTRIEAGAFADCASITSVTLPATITTIGASPFSGCTNLIYIEDQALTPATYEGENYTMFGSKVKKMVYFNPASSATQSDYVTDWKLYQGSYYAIKGSPRQTSIDGVEVNYLVTSETDKTCMIGIADQSTNLLAIPSTYTGAFTIPETIEGYTVTEISDGAFVGCQLSALTIPATVETIGFAAFRNCSKLAALITARTTPAIFVSNPYFSTTSVPTAYVPASALSAYKAASYWKKLTYAEEGEGYSFDVEYSGYKLTYKITDIEAKTCQVGLGQDLNASPSRNYMAGTTTALSAPDEGTADYSNITVPETALGYTVTALASGAFSKTTDLTSITLPASIDSIAEGAFYDCKNLTAFEFPTSLTKLGGGVFWGCSSLASAHVPQRISDIGAALFRGCSALTEVTIPGATSIGAWTFYNCSSLTNIELPSTVETIGSEAFYDCQGLQSIVVPESVENIGSNAFNGCTSLATANLPANITSIASGLFYNCSKLQLINIPSTVTCIGEYNQEIKGETNVEIISVIA